jgi:hypothetical protein
MSWQIALARIRFPLLVLGAVVLLSSPIVGPPGIVVLGVFVAYIVLVRVGSAGGEPTVVRPPVVGRWRAINSPADRVPSHGIQAYGQAYAVDLVHEPEEGARPGQCWWPLARRAADFPAFGQPILAPADGVVVRVHDRERDHWSRNSWPSLLYVIVEGLLRELTGPNRIVGNNVVIDIGDGRHVLAAHLQRGSISVAVGQPVRAGEPIARCGNSGNSSEPHLHLQVMDHPNLLVAAGLPMAFDGYEIGGAGHTGLPGRADVFDAPARELPGA